MANYIKNLKSNDILVTADYENGFGSIDFIDFDGTTVEIANGLSGNTNLTNVNNADIINEDIDNLFNGDTALEDVEGLTFELVKSAESAFRNNSSLTGISANFDQLENGNYMFGSDWFNQGQRASAGSDTYCTALTSANLGSLSNLKSAKGMFCRAGLTSFSADCSELEDAECMFGVYHHNDNLSNTALTSVTLGDLRKLKNASKMFGTAKNLTGFTAQLDSIENTYRMFNGCPSLVEVSLGSLSTLINAGNMFYSAGLETINFTGTTLLENASYFAAYMPNVTSITLNCDNVTNAEGMAQFIQHPFTVNFGSMSKVQNGSQMFTASKIQSFSADMTSLTNGNYMFGGIWAGCANCAVESVDLGATPNLSSAVQMFSGATALTSVTMSNISALTETNDMFKDANNIVTLNLGHINKSFDFSSIANLSAESVKYIADNAENSSNGTLKFPNSLSADTIYAEAYQTLVSKGWSVMPEAEVPTVATIEYSDVDGQGENGLIIEEL